MKFDDLSKLPAGGGSTKLSGIPHWDESPEAYERVIIKGVTLPGAATVSGDGYKRRVDKKRTPGLHGETTTDLGQDAAEIEITLELWTAQHLADFHTMVKRVLAPRRKTITVTTTQETQGFAGFTVNGAEADGATQFTVTKKTVDTGALGGPGPVDIYFPTLALFGITKVQILSIGLPVQKTKDIFECRIKCTQYFAQKKAAVTTNEKSGGGSFAKRLGGNAFENPPIPKPSETIAASPTYTPGSR